MKQSTIDSELEAKLLAESDEDLDSLAGLDRLGPYRLQPRPRQPLYSLYLDTKDLTLTRHAMAVRVRRCGNAWEATVKWAGSVRGSIHERPEMNVPLPGPPGRSFSLPAELHARLVAILAGRKLAPALVTEIDRQPIDVFDTSNRRVAEIAIDRVYLHSPRSSDKGGERYGEIEIERKQGSRTDVQRIATLLGRRAKLKPSQATKLGRGMNLLYGVGDVVANSSLELSPGEPAASAARKLIATHRARLIEADIDSRLGSDRETAHKLRVACRRLRAVLRTLADTLADHRPRQLRKELQWLGRSFGAARDIDVQLEHLQKLEGRARNAGRPFAEHLQERRRQEHAAMLAALNSPRYFRLLRRLEALADSDAEVPPGERIDTVAATAIRKTFRKLCKLGDKIGQPPEAEDLHRVRIAAKRVRYASELVRERIGKDGRQFVKKLVVLQDLLGSYNDAIVANQCIDDFRRKASPPPATRRVLETLAASNQARAAKAAQEFHRVWKDLTRRQQRRNLESILSNLADSRNSSIQERCQ